MASIVPLNSIYFAGNMPDIGVQSLAASATVELKLNGNVISTEVYTPVNGGFVVKVKYLIDSLLYLSIPPADQDLILQGGCKGLLEITVTDGGVQATDSCYIVKGGVDSSIDTEVFLESNFLTWQPQQKRIQYSDPEWLTYCTLRTCDVKVKGYFSDLTDQTINFAQLQANFMYTLNMAYPRMILKFASAPVYMDVWIEDNATGDRLTYIQRYVFADPAVQYNDVFVFENTLGGIDTLHFLGELKETSEINYDSALFGEETIDYDIDISRLFEKKTGYVEKEAYRYWWLEFFKSLQRYHISEGALKKIVVSKPKLESVAGVPNSYEFTFAYALQTKYISLPRLDALPAIVEIVDPNLELFFLAPRLAQFPWIDLDDNPLIAVQLPNSDSWGITSVRKLLESFNNSQAINYHEHTQSTPSAEWICVHNLGKYPNVSIGDINLEEMHGDVKHLDLDTTRIKFKLTQRGTAIFTI